MPTATVQRAANQPPTTVQRVAQQSQARLLCSRHCNTTGPAQQTVFPNGTIVRKRFANVKFHDGKVISYNTVNQYYCIKYCNGDSEEFINNNSTAITSVRHDIPGN